MGMTNLTPTREKKYTGARGEVAPEMQKEPPKVIKTDLGPDTPISMLFQVL